MTANRWDDIDTDAEAEARAVAQITSRAVRANGGPATIPEPMTAVERHASSRLDWRALYAKEHTDDDWLLEPLIPRGRGVSVVAKAKSEKSLLYLYLAASLAAGRPVLRRPAGDPVDVMYLDMEMTEDDVLDRLTEMGFGAEDLDHLHYHLLPSLSPLDTTAGGAEVVELAHHYKAELVIVDTLSRVLSGPENDSDTIRNYYTYTGRPLKAAGVANVRLDHLGKDATKGGRGSSAKADDVDLVWEITRRDQDHLDLKATHKRMSWVPATAHLHRTDDPISYQLVDNTWPAGTAGVATALDRLNVTLDASRSKARDVLHEANVPTGGNAVLSAALRYRRTDPRRQP